MCLIETLVTQEKICLFLEYELIEAPLQKYIFTYMFI
jgi:hypothetical protein